MIPDDDLCVKIGNGNTITITTETFRITPHTSYASTEQREPYYQYY